MESGIDVMNVREPTNYRDRIVDEAAAWFTRMEDLDPKVADREAFADWLRASAEHVREYLALMAMRADLGRLQVETLLRAAHSETAETAENVVPLFESATGDADVRPRALEVRSSPGERHGVRRPALRTVLAAMFVLAAVSLLWLSSEVGSSVYRTGIGEQKSFALPDGSVVTLNAVSKLQVRYTASRRDVYLSSGEALFVVAKDTTRPFRVLTGRALIRAVGTRFNVYHRQQDTTVSVVEGTVEVQTLPGSPGTWPAFGSGAARAVDAPAGVPSLNDNRPASMPVRVTRGQRAHLDSQSGAVAVALANLEADTAWRERRLVFDSSPLRAAVEEFNLYNDMRLVISDDALGAVEVSGSFYANDPRSFALFLEEAKLAALNVQGDGTIVLRGQ